MKGIAKLFNWKCSICKTSYKHLYIGVFALCCLFASPALQGKYVIFFSQIFVYKTLRKLAHADIFVSCKNENFQ